MTRHATYSSCPRRFFYNDIAAPRNEEIAGFRDRQAPPLIRHQMVRTLLSAFLEAGAGEPPDAEAAFSRARGVLEGALRDGVEVNVQMSVIESCVSNYIDSYHDTLCSHGILYVTDGKPVEFVYAGLSMMALPELALDRGDDIQIVSWKTGSVDFRSQHEFSLRAGGLTCWARTALKEVERPVVVTEVHLRDSPHVFDVQLTDDAIRTFVSQAKEVSGLYSASAKVRDFPARPDYKGCRFCPYQSICPEWLDFSEADYSIAALGDEIVADRAVSSPGGADTERRVVFLCHVTEDKDALVRPFARALEADGIAFWLDEAEIHWGDSLTRKVNEGLRQSDYVLCFLSPEFLKRGWPQAELAASLSAEFASGGQRVLPVLVAEAEEIFGEMPLIRDKKCMQWDDGIEALLRELRTVIDRDVE